MDRMDRMDRRAACPDTDLAPAGDAGVSVRSRAIVRDVFERAVPLRGPEPIGPDLELSLPAEPGSVGIVRHVLGGLAEAAGLDPEGLADVRLAVSEACTNVVVHAYAGGPRGRLDVEARIERPLLHVVVRDRGHGLAPRADSPGLGIGLPLLAAVAERVQLTGSPEGTEVRMAFLVPESA